MQTFDMKNRPVFPYEEREKNELYSGESHKVRPIEMQKGEKLPPEAPCSMDTAVVFYVIGGQIGLTIDAAYGL